MSTLRKFASSIFVLLAITSWNIAHADPIDADDFVNDASAAGIAEIEAGRAALENASSQAVKKFAQTMIDDHTQANNELAAIARKKNLELADNATLMNRARQFILERRDGESFDVAYARNQVGAHERSVELFQRGTRAEDPDIKAFATKTLPKLEHHLQMARQLLNTTERAERDAAGTPQRGTDLRRETDRDRTTNPGVGTVPPTQHTN